MTIRWTNKFGVPAPLARAVMRDDYRRVGDISITGLIRPPQMAEIERRHADELEMDVSEGIWSLLGSAVHSVLERTQVDNALQEERLVMDVNGWDVSGKPDLLEIDSSGGRAEYIVSDYKCTSTWSFSFGLKTEWEQQVNCYAALYREHGFDVRRGQIVAILRDWVKTHAGEPGYPLTATMLMPVVLWPHEETMAFLEHRVALHQLARDNGVFDECTAEERWYRGEKWAVKKVGNKTAMSGGVKETLAEAEKFVENAKAAQAIEQKRKPAEFTIEHRPGKNIRCESYCMAAPWCQQAKRLLGESSDAAKEGGPLQNLSSV